MLNRRGFVLIGVIVIVAIMAIAGAVVVPALASFNARLRAEAVAAEIRFLEVRFVFFRFTMGFAPGRVSHVSQPITIADSSGCTDEALDSEDADDWDSWNISYGPWVRDRVIKRHYGYNIQNGFGYVVDTLYRDPPGDGSTMLLTIHDVALRDAEELDLLMDGAIGAGVGDLRFGTQTAGQVTVIYRMPITCGEVG